MLNKEKSMREIANVLDLSGLKKLTDDGSGNSNFVTFLNYDSDGDNNGVFYYIGTTGLTEAWSNPITSGAVKTQTLPGVFFNVDYSVFYSVDRGASPNAMYLSQYNLDQRNWITYDFGSYALAPSYYTIMGREVVNSNFLKSWVLEGSNDNSNWDVLDTRTNDTQQGQGVWGGYSATSSKAYRYLRIRNTGPDSSGNNFLGIGEIEFYGSLFLSTPSTQSHSEILTYASNGDDNGLFYFIGTSGLTDDWENPISNRRVTCYTNDQYPANDYFPFRSVDRGATNYPWHNDGAAGGYVIYDFGSHRIKPSDYTMMGRADYNGLFARNWVLEGSNDLTNWTTLDTRTNETSQNQGTWGHYTASSSNKYRFLRVRSTGVDSDGGSYLTIGEIEFYGEVNF